MWSDLFKKVSPSSGHVGGWMRGRSPKNGGREGSWGWGCCQTGEREQGLGWDRARGHGQEGESSRDVQERKWTRFCLRQGRGEGTPTCLSLALEEAECPWLRVEMETQGNVMSSPPNLVELDIGDISPGLF